MTHILLTIERSTGNAAIWGRVLYEDNLIIESAQSVKTLEKKFKKLLHDFHGLNQRAITFERAYDLTSLFEKHNYLNISAIAQKTDINPSLMRQYASGAKTPSQQTALKVERTIHKIARELLEVRVSTPSTRNTGKRKVRKLEYV